MNNTGVINEFLRFKLNKKKQEEVTNFDTILWENVGHALVILRNFRRAKRADNFFGVILEILTVFLGSRRKVENPDGKMIFLRLAVLKVENTFRKQFLRILFYGLIFLIIRIILFPDPL